MNSELNRIIAEKDDKIASLKKENKKLRECHEAELGVCFKHCDEVIALKELVRHVYRIIATHQEYLERENVQPEASELKDWLNRAKEFIKKSPLAWLSKGGV